MRSVLGKSSIYPEELSEDLNHGEEACLAREQWGVEDSGACQPRIQLTAAAETGRGFPEVVCCGKSASVTRPMPRLSASYCKNFGIRVLGVQ